MTWTSVYDTIGHMTKVNEVSPIVGVLFVAVILLFVAFYLGLTRVDTFLKDNAIDNCALSARFERKDGTGTVTYPIDSFYKDCLKQKGI